MSGADPSRPCPPCLAGVHRHDAYSGPPCGCLEPHPGDDTLMRSFKAAKRQLIADLVNGIRGTSPGGAPRATGS